MPAAKTVPSSVHIWYRFRCLPPKPYPHQYTYGTLPDACRQNRTLTSANMVRMDEWRRVGGEGRGGREDGKDGSRGA
eukprot:2456182-Rhodomonas_salina.1